MKKSILLLFAATAMVFGVGCEKEPVVITGPAQFGQIKCKVNGEEKLFDVANGANLNIYDDNYSGSPNNRCIQMARMSSGGSLNVLTIDIFADLDDMVIPATFNYNNFMGGNYEQTDVGFFFSYTKLPSMYISWYENANATLTVTSKKGDVLMGTFSGKVFTVNPFTLKPDSLVVSDGTFSIKVDRKPFTMGQEYY